jgi:hypothetical protein
MKTPDSRQPSPQTAIEYDPPRIELVLTPEELEREVLYAGMLFSRPL